MPLARHVVTAVAHSDVIVLGIGAAGLWIGSKAARQSPQIQRFLESNQAAFAPHSPLEMLGTNAVDETQPDKRVPSAPVKLKASTARQTSPEAVHTQLSQGLDGKQAAAAQ
jgi:hypothetical protein